MAKKIQTSSKGKIRHLVFFSPGEEVPYRITGQIDHTWFLTVFGQDNIGKPYDVNEFMKFIQKTYDKNATFKMGSYGVANDCAPVLRFSEWEVAHKFLDDFTATLEKLA